MGRLTTAPQTGQRLGLALMACLALALPAQALMVAVFADKGSTASLEQLKAFSRAVQQNRDATPTEGVTYKSAPHALLTEEFSVTEGVSAYFWADETFESAEGFRMEGVTAHFEADFPVEEALAKEALDVERGPAIVYTTALRHAHAVQGSLTLGYSVAQAGRVKVEAIGLNGQRFGRWTFSEPGAGAYERSLTMNRAVKGPFYVRWSHGNVQAVQKVVPVKGER